MDAAKWLGIRIPTMCHVPGIEPASSCFLCAVQIEGRRTLSPACAMPVAEGMVVVTDSEDVRAARKMALELLLSDHAGECVAPCAAQCPAGLDIPGFVYGIATGDHRRAMEVIAERLALPGSLGRICPRLCERQCRRSDLDQGLAIGALHRYVAEPSHPTCRRARHPPGSRWPSWARAPRAWPPPTISCGTATPARSSTRTRSPEACCATESPPTACRRMRSMRKSTPSAGSAPGSGWASGGAKTSRWPTCASGTTRCSWPSGRSAPRGSTAKARNTPSPESSFWSAWPAGIRRRWATMSWWSAAAIRPWTAPAPRSGWARGTCGSSIAAAGRRCLA